MDNSFPWSVLLSTIEMMSKCSKLKWNHEPQESGFIVKFEHFDVISMVDKSTDQGKFLSICC